MPVFKIPIVHKFGIISHSQRSELQKQILAQTQKKDAKPSKSNLNPFQVSEEFVQKYNAANLEEKEALHCKVEQLLCRSKRRCGLLTSGEGNHVDLPLGWSELAILAQCKGKLQNDCLDVLCVSLNEAPLHEDNIPTLFFLAESSLYWLHADAMKQPYLRTIEIKLFKMGQLVFIRLMFHHLCGHLHGMQDLKVRLSSYMDAIRSQKSMYYSYPEILLSFEVIVAAGEQVVGPYIDSNLTAGHVMERTESVPALAASVYRALNVWRVAATSKVGLKKSIMTMSEAVPEISDARDWLSGFMAISLLGEAAKMDIRVCKFLQSIACGSKFSLTTMTGDSPIDLSSVSPPLTGQFNHDFEQRSDANTAEKKSFDTFTRQDTNSSQLFSAQRSSIQSGTNPINTPKGSGTEQSNSLLASMENPLGGNTRASGLGSWNWRNAYHYCVILTDICLSGTNAEIQKAALMGKWGDADVTTFRAGIANPCVESSGLADLLEYSSGTAKKTTAEKIQDWSWMVRYGALFGLNKIAHSLTGSKEKSGFRSAAWSLITSLQECAATEERILEALPVSQMEWNSSRSKVTSIWTRIAQQLSDVYLPSQDFIPPSSLTKFPQKSPRRQTTPKQSVSYPTAQSIKRPTLGEELLIHSAAPKITASFNVRKSMDLQRLVSDQWRKDLLKDQQSEETSRGDALVSQRKEDDESGKKLLEKRKEKLKGKPSALLGPYEVTI